MLFRGLWVADQSIPNIYCFFLGRNENPPPPKIIYSNQPSRRFPCDVQGQILTLVTNEGCRLALSGCGRRTGLGDEFWFYFILCLLAISTPISLFWKLMLTYSMLGFSKVSEQRQPQQ